MKKLKKITTIPLAEGFLGLTSDIYSIEDRPQSTRLPITVIPFGMENHVSYGGGTQFGPQAIIKASHQVELFDEELLLEPVTHMAIKTYESFQVSNDSKLALDFLSDIISHELSQNKHCFPLILGGEHALSVGVIRQLLSLYPDLVVLHFDAHADLRDRYEDSIYSHACAMRRVFELNTDLQLISCGIRNLSIEEYQFATQNQERVHLFFSKDKRAWNFDHVLERIKGRPIYISFDVDAFDSSVMPATGTPEPGGLMWDEALTVIRRFANQHRIIGADIVEYSPINGLHSCDFLVAKLAYKIMSYAMLNR